MTLAPPLPPPTRGGLLPDAARLVLPAGIVSTGFPATEATCRRIGIEFDPWQAELNRAILAKDAEGLYAADTVALSICRQAGKTYDVGGLVFADSIINPGTTSVWTAHRFKVARESFNEMRAWAKSPLLKHHIEYDDITTAAGNECIPFRNGSRVVFAARERGAIRGFTKVRRLVLDEGQILSEAALSDLAPTMNQAKNPQLVLMGTPPKPTDPSEVWTRLRAEALAGESEGLLYVEFSAPAGCDPLDREAWRKANPSYPLRTPDKAILRLRKLLSPADFEREALGIWDSAGAARWLVIKEPAWTARGGADGRPDSPVAFGISAQWPDAEFGSIAVVGRGGSEVLAQVVERRPGTSWIPARMRELQDAHSPCAVVLDDKDPAVCEKAALAEAGVKLTPLSMVEAGQAFATFLAAVAGDAPYLRHYDQDELTDAVKGGQTRPVGDARTWARKGAADVSAVQAVTNALHGLLTAEVAPFFGAYR